MDTPTKAPPSQKDPKGVIRYSPGKLALSEVEGNPWGIAPDLTPPADYEGGKRVYLRKMAIRRCPSMPDFLVGR